MMAGPCPINDSNPIPSRFEALPAFGVGLGEWDHRLHDFLGRRGQVAVAVMRLPRHHVLDPAGLGIHFLPVLEPRPADEVAHPWRELRDSSQIGYVVSADASHSSFTFGG